MNATSIREFRDMTGETQKEFAERYQIPLSTLKKWEQGTASPAPYVLQLIAESLPFNRDGFQKVQDKDGKTYYFNTAGHLVSDQYGNLIHVQGDLNAVDPHNLAVYLRDLFADYHQAVDRFNRDCSYDAKEKIRWS